MSQPIKVPKEVMELVYEQQACEALAQDSGWLRAIVYRQKAFKLEALIWRTMNKVFPQTKPRKSRAAKPAADPANSLGE